MRSKDGLTRLRNGRMRQFGVMRLRHLIFIPFLLTCVIAMSMLRNPPLQSVRFLPDETPHHTPMAGWAVRAEDYGKDPRLDSSLLYVELTWAELEPRKNHFAFEELETTHHMRDVWEQGGQVILRISLDNPGENGHMDIPEWLYDLTGGDGQFYETEAGAGYAPNYTNFLLRERHAELIYALAERYDNHPGIAYIEVGSLGAHGSWTVESENGVNALPISTISRLYTGHYTLSFTQTPLLLSRPYKEAIVEEVGLYNIDLGDVAASWKYLYTLEDGGYDEQIDTNLYAMPDFWQKAPAGGHIASLEQLTTLLADEQVLGRLLRESHMSYAVLPETSSLSDEQLEKLNHLANEMGYHLWVRAAEWDAKIHRGYRLTVHLTLRNDGCAPLYGVYPATLALFDGKTQLTSTPTQMDVRAMLPGDNVSLVWLDIPYTLEPGTYALKFMLSDETNNFPGIPLTVQGELTDGWLTLGEVEIIP